MRGEKCGTETVTYGQVFLHGFQHSLILLQLVYLS